MDLEDLYSDMDDEELGALFSIGGSVRAGTSTKPSASGTMRLVPRSSSGGGLFGIGRIVRSATSTARLAASRAAKAAALAKKKKRPSRSRQALLRAMLKSKTRPKYGKVGRRVYQLKPKRVTRYSQFPLPSRAPISSACPAAYRQLACNAGLGGSAGLALLKQIKDMVALSNTRQVATSEHNRINDTKAFRRAVLKRLSRRARCK